MCRWFYVYQLKVLCTITALDLISFLIRIHLYFNSSIVLNSTTEIQSTLVLIAFILDGIASIIIASAFIIMALLVLANHCLNYGTGRIQTGEFSAQNGVQSLRRMLIMTSNYPSYRARPKLRFLIRMTLAVLCIILRMTAAFLYSKANFHLLMVLCVIFQVSLIIILAFDLYHYRVWWYYRRANDHESTPFPTRNWRNHPYHSLGKNRNPMTLDNEPCTQAPCQNRELEHTVTHHHSEYQQEHWSEMKNQTDIYVEFHQTNADAAVSIAHNDIPLNCTPPPPPLQMLGFGIYFARSIKHTEKTARHGTADGGILFVQRFEWIKY